MNWFLLHFIHYVLIKILIQERIKIVIIEIELSGPVVKNRQGKR